MNELLDKVRAQLEHYTHDEAIALIHDFLIELDDAQQRRFLALVEEGPRPLVAEQMDLAEDDDLLDAIQALHEAIADDEYVEYGVGYDPDYGTHRGFGDDSWIERMDDLFAAATSLFRAGQFAVAAEAYIALFRIFDLNQDGFHFTRPDPAAALRTDLDEMKRHLYIAIARSDPTPVVTAIALARELYPYGANRYALLDAWESRTDLIDALLAELIERAHQPTTHYPAAYWTFPVADLLREYYRRHRTLPDYEALCRAVGPQQGWPYEELVVRYGQQANWEQALAWADDGLRQLPAESGYRPMLQEARGEALLHLNRPAEAQETLLTLFAQDHSASVYLKLREAALATGRWQALWPELAAELRAYVMARAEGTRVSDDTVSYSGDIFPVSRLLGFAYLLEGDWPAAVAWAADRKIPPGWGDEDLPRIVATGLLRMALVARGTQLDDVLATALAKAPELVREHGALLDSVARSVPADPLLDGAVQLYERLVEGAIEGRSRPYYAQAGAVCTVIRSVRRIQSREAEFERYYQGLLTTYTRFPALKDELRTAVEGAGYKRKR